MIRFGIRKLAAGMKLCAVLLFVILAMDRAFADSVVEVVPERSVFDLSQVGTRVAAQRRNLTLEVPGDAEGQSRVLELRAQGPGPEFNWTIYAIKNSGPDPRDLLLVIDQQAFAGSGLWPIRAAGPQITNVLWAPVQQGLNWQRVSGDDMLAFRLAAGASMSIALEGRADIRDARLVDEGSFQRRSMSITFLRGAAMSATFLVMVGLLAAFGFRANRALLAGSFFCFASLAFMALDAGYWARLPHSRRTSIPS